MDLEIRFDFYVTGFIGWNDKIVCHYKSFMNTFLVVCFDIFDELLLSGCYHGSQKSKY